jgi:hypothetical protein
MWLWAMSNGVMVLSHAKENAAPDRDGVQDFCEW